MGITELTHRDYTFRVWDIVAKKMSPEFGLFGEFTLLGAVHEWQREVRNDYLSNSLDMLNDLVIMQSSGIKDANDKYIFDGDIISMDVMVSEKGDSYDNRACLLSLHFGLFSIYIQLLMKREEI